MRSYFLQSLIKEKSPTNKKTGEINNIFYKLLKSAGTYLATLQKTGRASEDLNLPIEDQKKSHYPTSNNGTITIVG